MADQLTCGQGLAQNAPLRTKLGELVGSTSGVLEVHMAALDPGDEDTEPERRAYQRLAREHREVGARLLVLGEEMAGYRDLPMGRHDPGVMASVPAVEAFERFVQVEQELLALLQQRVPQDQRMLEQMTCGGTSPAQLQHDERSSNRSVRRPLMSIVGGLDVHRQQITFDYLDTDTGLVRRGKLAPADRMSLRAWLARFTGLDAELAVEGCTGWRFIAEECARAGVRIHVADPGDAAAARGRKRHAKTDQLDARHLRQLLAEGRLPESWIPPEQVLEVRARVRLYKDLQDERGDWLQRVRATCFHQGLPARRALFTPEGRAWLETTDGLSDAGRQAVTVALRQLDRLDDELVALRRDLVAYARRQPGCRALWTQLYGVGGLTSVMIWAELGDTRRFSSSRHSVRHTGLDITVYASDGKRARGHLARQGPPLLRWALFEAAKSAAKRTSPDHDYDTTVAARAGANRATLAVARKLVRRAHHVLRELGDQAFAAA